MDNERWTKHEVLKEVDSSEVLYLGIGENNYGKVMRNDQGFPCMPFYPFPAKVENKKLKVDLTADTIVKHSDPEINVYKFTIPFADRIKLILNKLDEPQKLFFERNQIKLGTELDFIKDALESFYRVQQSEYYNFKDPNDKYWTNEKRIKDIAFSHKMIAIIEFLHFNDEKKSNNEATNITIQKQSEESYEILIKEALAHYDHTHQKSVRN